MPYRSLQVVVCRRYRCRREGGNRGRGGGRHSKLLPGPAIPRRTVEEKCETRRKKNLGNPGGTDADHLSLNFDQQRVGSKLPKCEQTAGILHRNARKTP